MDWEHFQVGSDHYLIVSNAQQGPESGVGNEVISAKSTNAIYRWQGVEKFVPVHQLFTLPSADWETFQVGETTYLVYANAEDNISQVYRVKLQ